MPTLDDDEVIVARLSLGELRGQPISVKADFLDAFRPIAPEINLRAEGELKEGLKGTFQVRRLVSRGERGVLRQDRFIARGAVEAKKLAQDLSLGARAQSLLPFNLKAGAEVSFSRMFDHEDQATRAPLLTPLHLPFDRARALALPEGTVVQIPVEAQVSLNLSGQHLSRSWGRFDELSGLLKSSAAGYTSAATQGVLLARGTLAITVTRHADDRVRVRIQGYRRRNADVNTIVNATAYQKFTLFPAATVDRIRSIREQLVKWGKRPSDHLRTWSDRLATLKRRLPALLRPLLDESRVESYPEQLRAALEYAEERLDPALEILERGEADLESASAWIAEKVDATLGRVDRRLNPLFERAKRHSERAFNASISMRLSAGVNDQAGVLGDYLINLSHETGALAFESLLSGRARWEGLDLEDPGSLGLIDLTLIDGLVAEGHEHVRCLRRAELESSERRLSMSVDSPVSAWHFSDQSQNHELDITIEGRRELWEAKQWRFAQGLRALVYTQNETLVSGQLARKDLYEDVSGAIAQDDGAWVYWMSWSKQWPMSASTPVHEAFAEALNLSGSVGISRGLAQHFFDNAPGALSAQLTLVFHQALLDEIFERVDPDLIWTAAALTAERFDNRFGLPFLPALRTPELSMSGARACEVIAFHWGRRYCGLIQDEIIDPLLDLRASEQPLHERHQAQREWLASLYRKRLLLNPIGARVIVRLLCEVAALMERADEVGLRFRLQHPQSPSVSLNVVLEGKDETTQPADSDDQPSHAIDIAEWLGLGEGINYWP